MDDRRINWETAQVDTDGTLTVDFVGEADALWTESFGTVLGYLSEETRGGVWGDVEVTTDTVRVHEVDRGSTTALKDFLEAALRQANDLSARERTDRQRRGVDEDSPELDEETARGMTDEFRNT